MRPRRRPSRHTIAPLDTPPLLHLWVLRLLVPLGGNRKLIGGDGLYDDGIAEIVGLGDWIDSERR